MLGRYDGTNRQRQGLQGDLFNDGAEKCATESKSPKEKDNKTFFFIYFFLVETASACSFNLCLVACSFNLKMLFKKKTIRK